MATLLFSVQDHKLFECKISSHNLIIGRSDTCDVALPGEGLSRQHCRIEKRGRRWMLTDLSKHGTFIDGERITRQLLLVGQTFQIGLYTVQIQEEKEDVSETVAVLAPRHHEFVVAYDTEILVERAILTVVSGPEKGTEIRLKQVETSVGTSGRLMINDPALLPSHFTIVVSRGRPMVTPTNGPVFLEGHRLLNTTPIYPDDVFSAGQSKFSIQIIKGIDQHTSAEQFGSMIGVSDKMQQIFGRLKVFACHDFPVLIVGESGTGKELAARGIHQHSQRASGPFVPINCASIPESLLESELFGHEKGAFSGATSRHDGAFQQAHHGTLFLDELGELPMSAQVKLLRVLESGDIRRVGGTQVEFPDVRIVAATNRNLDEMVKDGTFREDLLFRLQVLSVYLPPLRARKEDVMPIAQRLCQDLGFMEELSYQVRQMLWNYTWPGNVRELRNVLSRAFVLGMGVIRAEHIEINSSSVVIETTPEMMGNGAFLEKILQACDGNISLAARQLGVPRTTLFYKMKKLGIAD